MSAPVQATINKPQYVPPAAAAAAMPAARVEQTDYKSSHTDTMAPAKPLEHAAPIAQAIALTDADIPHIDIAKIKGASEAERASLVKAFGDGLRDVGFIAIKAESLMPLIALVTAQMDKYFALPLAAKVKDDHKNGGQTGFSQRGSETAAGASEPDNKEFFHISPNLDRWPAIEGSAEFRQAMQQYHKELTAYAATLMGLVEDYLCEKTEDVEKSVSSAPNLLRLIHYPQTEGNAPRAAAHCDLNALTLLPPATEPGLQLLDKQGRWRAVTVKPGYLIVNTGEQLEIKTAGKIKATRHQVMKLEANAPKRLASVFFASWSSDFRLKPFDSCVAEMTKGMSESAKAAYLSRYPDVSVNENLLSRLIEMRTIREPAEGLVRDLHSKGLLKAAPPELRNKYPDLFDTQGNKVQEKDLVVIKA